MKHAFSIIAGLLLFAVTAQAQMGARTSAFNYFRGGDYAKAIEYIEPCTKHEKTMNSAKTWMWRGMIYQNLYQSQGAAEMELKKKHPHSIQIAVESYLKASTLDTKRIDKTQLETNLRIGGQQLVNEGIGEYNEKEYETALKSFDLASQAASTLGTTDTLAIYNAALAAEKAGKSEMAIASYQKCIDANYGGAKVYYFLANMQLEGGDAESFNKTIEAGRAKYPSDQSLITAQINIYLKGEDSEKALSALNDAITNDPANASLFFARGTIQEKLGNIDAAMSDYNKAVEIKADYFDGWYNMGALYFNKGVDLINQANELPTSEQKQYDEMKGQATDAFKTALPYLENAEKLNPDDKNTLLSLKELYLRTSNTEGYKRINEKLEN